MGNVSHRYKFRIFCVIRIFFLVMYHSKHNLWFLVTFILIIMIMIREGDLFKIVMLSIWEINK